MPAGLPIRSAFWCNNHTGFIFQAHMSPRAECSTSACYVDCCHIYSCDSKDGFHHAVMKPHQQTGCRAAINSQCTDPWVLAQHTDIQCNDRGVLTAVLLSMSTHHRLIAPSQLAGACGLLCSLWGLCRLVPPAHSSRHTASLDKEGCCWAWSCASARPGPSWSGQGVACKYGSSQTYTYIW